MLGIKLREELNGQNSYKEPRILSNQAIEASPRNLQFKHSEVYQKTPNSKKRNSNQANSAKIETKKLKKQSFKQHAQKSASKKKGNALGAAGANIMASVAGVPLGKTTSVDTLVVGGGPAALGFLINALKTGRLHDLIRSKDEGYGNNNGLAILEEGVSFGGGLLGSYGINSNTSAQGFLKCMQRPSKKPKQKGKSAVAHPQHAGLHIGSPQHMNIIYRDVSQNQREKIEKLHKNFVGGKCPNTQKVQSLKGSSFKAKTQDKSKKVESIPAVYHEPEILSAFKDLSMSRIVKVLTENFGKDVAPLPVVGHLLNHIGNSVLFYIYQLFSNQERQCRVFYPMHKVESIQLMQNGDCLVKAIRTNFTLLSATDEDASSGFLAGYHYVKNVGQLKLWVAAEKETVYFRARSVIMANGGEQIVHPQFFNWFPFRASQPESVITSDYFLKKEGFIHTMKMLGRKNTLPRKKKIVIVGGSHSGFSCAWLMLNQRPAQDAETQRSKIFQDGKAPGANRRQLINCKVCCKCGVQKAAHDIKMFQAMSSNLMGRQSDASVPAAKCRSCVCKCFGVFAFEDWEIEENFREF